MIEARRWQRRFGDGFVAETVADLHEPWMPHADRMLNDDALLSAVDEALGQRHPKSRTRGRRGAPAEMVLRLLVLKHLRHWSYAILERDVRANLVSRDFTRVGGGTVPDAKTLGRWGVAVGPAVIETLHGRLIAIAQQAHVVEGRKMRVDTTVVETNIHYPTDSSVLGDGVRVLTRAMKKVTAIAGTVGTRLRDRSRRVTHRVLEIGRIARSKGAQRQDHLTRAYQRLLASTSRVGGQAKRCSREIGAGVKRTGDVLHHAALGWPAAGVGHLRAPRATGDATSPCARVRRRSARGGQVTQPLRTEHGSDPQGPSEQAHRVWHSREASRGRESNHHGLCRV